MQGDVLKRPTQVATSQVCQGGLPHPRLCESFHPCLTGPGTVWIMSQDSGIPIYTGSIFPPKSFTTHNPVHSKCCLTVPHHTKRYQENTIIQSPSMVNVRTDWTHPEQTFSSQRVESVSRTLSCLFQPQCLLNSIVFISSSASPSN